MADPFIRGEFPESSGNGPSWPGGLRFWIVGSLTLIAIGASAVLWLTNDPPGVGGGSICGNDEAEFGEQCDGTDLGTCSLGATCTEDCECAVEFAAQMCGNGVAEGSEECDGSDVSGCSPGASCSESCACVDELAVETCGDGIAEGAEGCDGSHLATCAPGEVCSEDCTCVPLPDELPDTPELVSEEEQRARELCKAQGLSPGDPAYDECVADAAILDPPPVVDTAIESIGGVCDAEGVTVETFEVFNCSYVPASANWTACEGRRCTTADGVRVFDDCVSDYYTLAEWVPFCPPVPDGGGGDTDGVTEADPPPDCPPNATVVQPGC